MQLEIVPEEIDGALVFNVQPALPSKEQLSDEDLHSELVVAFHNWAKENSVPYIILDLQDQKDLCSVFLTELLQLRRRLQIPFLFAGVMESSRKIIESYDFQKLFPFFVTPEDAIRALRMRYPGMTESFSVPSGLGNPILIPRVVLGESDPGSGPALDS